MLRLSLNVRKKKAKNIVEYMSYSCPQSSCSTLLDHMLLKTFTYNFYFRYSLFVYDFDMY